MSAEPDTIAPTSGPKKRLKIRWAGPGVIMAVSGIGASDVIAATVGGATYGTSLLWALVLGTCFKFLQRPLLVVVIFTIIGSLFIPFLVRTLLYLNDRIAWRSAIAHNQRTTNVVLVVVLLLFLAVVAWEIPSLFR